MVCRRPAIPMVLAALLLRGVRWVGPEVVDILRPPWVVKLSELS